jgi:hypothetical protein
LGEASLVIRRFFAGFSFLFIALALGSGSAHAADIPHLTWERSAMQQVAVDTVIASNISHLDLLGQSQTLQFATQGVSDGREVYRVLLPANFPLGQYSVRAYLSDGTTRDYGNVRVVEYQSGGYNPLTDTKRTGALAITFFALLATWAAGREEQLRASEQSGYSGDQSTLGTVNAESVGRSASELRKHSAGLVTSIGLDHWRSDATIRSARFSTLLSRLISDGGYLQFSLGSLVLFFPVIGLLGGTLAFHDISGIGYITTPSLGISIFLVILGTLDAGAGFLAAISFGVLALTSHYFASAYDIRTFLGLGLLWMTPSLMANATRMMRRSAREIGWWDRSADVLVGSVIAGWAVRQLVLGLDGFAHLTLPLSKHANEVGYVAAGAIAVRYLIEEYVNRRNPYYLAYLSPEATHTEHSTARLVAWITRSVLFLFFAISFLGEAWQLWAALALFITPTIIGVFKTRFPNSSFLFQLLPVGVPSIIVMTLIGRWYDSWVQHSHLSAASNTRTLFVVMAIPGCFFGLVRMFGRAPRAGDVRWYMRPSMRLFYRLLGPLLFIIALGLNTGVI